MMFGHVLIAQKLFMRLFFAYFDDFGPFQIINWSKITYFQVFRNFQKMRFLFQLVGPLGVTFTSRFRENKLKTCFLLAGLPKLMKINTLNTSYGWFQVQSK